MIRVVILGSGNVAQHFIRAFGRASGVDLLKVWARHPQDLSHLLAADKITSSLEELPMADVYIISVLDDAIAGLSAALPFANRLVVHTSGTKSIDEIRGANRSGVFYPLQTFSKTRLVDYSQIPFCLEADSGDIDLLKKLAATVSSHIYEMDSDRRKTLHVAAVFVSNFVNHLYVAAKEIAAQKQIPFDVLKPLIMETAAKVQTLDPRLAQTGPAIRRDQGTVAAHLEYLKDSPYALLYQIITQSIQHEQKL